MHANHVCAGTLEGQKKVSDRGTGAEVTGCWGLHNMHVGSQILVLSNSSKHF